MDVNINIIDEKIVCVKIEGDFSIFDEDFDLFAKEVIAYTKMGIIRYVIDLSDVGYIDSSGVGVIIRLAREALKSDLKVCIVNPQPAVERVFVVSNIDGILQTVESVDEGIQYYN